MSKKRFDTFCNSGRTCGLIPVKGFKEGEIEEIEYAAKMMSKCGTSMVSGGSEKRYCGLTRTYVDLQKRKGV